MKTTADATVAIKLDSGQTVLVTVNERKNTEWNELNKKTRVSFGYHKVEKELLGDHPPFGSERGDGSDEDKAWRAYNRAELKLQRELGTKLFGLWDVEFKGHFSRKAGCSCGCSPAWILDNDRGRYMWVDVAEII